MSFSILEIANVFWRSPKSMGMSFLPYHLSTKSRMCFAISEQ